MKTNEPIKEQNKIKIKESGEELVSLKKNCPEVIIKKYSFQKKHHFVRQTISEMLNRAAKQLPKDHRLYVWTTLRTIQDQKRVYNRFYNKFKKEHPEWPKNILRRETNRFAHPPDIKTPPGHCTGGAIDLSILGPDNKILDMTTLKSGKNPRRFETAKTNDPKLSKIAQQNRQLLIKAMTSAGFTNYPGEWWHWSYGDSCWALRIRRKVAIYGLINQPKNLE